MLWGKGGRGPAVAVLAMLCLVVPFSASADKGGNAPGTYVSPSLLKGDSSKKFDVIVQSSAGVNGASNALNASAKGLGVLNKLTHKLGLIGAVSVQNVSSGQLKKLQGIPGLTVTPDAAVKLMGDAPSSNQIWSLANNIAPLWSKDAVTCATDPLTGLQLDPTCTPSAAVTAPPVPAIAIVDSGIDQSRVADFGARVVTQVDFLPDGSVNTAGGDGYGHGTFVAGMAAGSAPGYAGAAPNANLVSLDVTDDSGATRTSDVIAAAQWIYDNKATYGIKVANFSLHSGAQSNFTTDPLDKAVEKLWFSGVTVVAAAGNYGSATGPSGVLYAPGNDPFVITVGATDVKGTVDAADDTVAPFSAYGKTHDGFSKPELSAAGRYMIGPMSAGTIVNEKPDHMVAPGYMQVSGTSFSAPLVAGSAAQVLAQHPDWTPDQVKGALMESAYAMPLDVAHAAGVGELNAAGAVADATPPNPNVNLDSYVVADPNGGAPVFDGSSWLAAVQANPNWNASAYSDIAWSDIAWSDIAWSDIAWSDIAWSDIAWSDIAWSDIAWSDGALDDFNPAGGYLLPTGK